MSYDIEFEPVGRRGGCPEGKNLLECARSLGVGLASVCGGTGKCKTCKIAIKLGKVSLPSAIERENFSEKQIDEGWRLACLTYPESDCLVHVPAESLTSLQRLQVESRGDKVVLEPAVKSCNLSIPAPSLQDTRSDLTRLLNTVNKACSTECQEIDFKVLQKISTDLRSWNWQSSISFHGREIIAVMPLNSRHLGLAVDLGTTKIAAYLLDLDNGELLVSRGIMNPQISYGEDISSRMLYALKSGDNASMLQKITVESLNGLSAGMCTDAGFNVNNILDSVIVGNTAMHHLLLGLSVAPLAYPPFAAVVQDPLNIKSREIGLHLAPGSNVHMLSNIAGFVGADHVAMLLASKAALSAGSTLAIDIGTNTEVSLINHGQIISASCASGPAFEGGHISCGMRSSSGAIERVRLENNQVQYQTIEDAAPVGICGSGIIDAVAQMYLSGIINEKGTLKSTVPGVIAGEKQRYFTLVKGISSNRDLIITQHDIREIQLAKSAIRAGIQVLLDHENCSDQDINQVIIAGAFGTYIDISNAIEIGMLPDIPVSRYLQVGNAAGQGAIQTLLSIKKRDEAKIIAGKIRYIELATDPAFSRSFIQAQYLGKYQLKNGQRIKAI